MAKQKKKIAASAAKQIREYHSFFYSIQCHDISTINFDKQFYFFSLRFLQGN